ncbi:class I SAM-dependent methyltransferase [Patescibacteria group bacterium]|nr:class I SAM-dependent methyltransferase [Patescibacteria group bacterium]MBU1931065.1 class I SAM-dependent methyltransferase [Patescibacteria group bacterium]
MTIKKFISRKLAKHFRKPSGLLGKIAGTKMNKLNDEQNSWVLSLLKIKSDDNVLEIGYGPGKTIQKLAKIVTRGKICGVDFSTTMFKVASRLNKVGIKNKKINLKCGEAENIPFEKNYFDKVMTVHTVYFWPDLMRVFTEIYRVIKTKGQFALGFIYPILTQNEFFISYTPEEIKQKLNKSNFKKVKVKTKTFGKRNGICLLAQK